MRSTYIFKSAIVYWPPHILGEPLARVTTKARMLSKRSGWLSSPIFKVFTESDFRADLIGWADGRRSWTLRPTTTLKSVREGNHLYEFGLGALIATKIHGGSFPTWIGDLYIKPIFEGPGALSGTSGFGYLVTEAPDLDCGHWEEDALPFWGA